MLEKREISECIDTISNLLSSSFELAVSSKQYELLKKGEISEHTDAIFWLIEKGASDTARTIRKLNRLLNNN